MSDDELQDSLLGKEELDELRGAIAALRGQLDRGLGRAARGRDGHGFASGVSELADRVRAELEEFDPLELFSDVRRRLTAFSAQPISSDIDEFGFDPAARARVRPVLDFLFDRWWRVQVSGAEHIPEGARLIFVANRSGVLPYDGLMIAHALARELGAEPGARFLVADWLLRLPFAQSSLARVGGVRACAENVERLLRMGLQVVAFPEGQKGALKLFHDRYRLQRFARGGFVSIAVREGGIIVPVGVVGAEEVHPVLYESRFTSRLLGIPALVTPTFPHLGLLGLVPLPSSWRIRFGEPVRCDRDDPALADDPLYVNRRTEQIRSTVQKLLDAEIRRRASQP